jgi:hypothetical protein
MHPGPGRHICKVGPEAEEIAKYLRLREVSACEDAVCYGRAASKGFYENCGQPSVGVLQTPMSWLRHAEDPFVAVLVNSSVGSGNAKTRCGRALRKW